MYLHETTNYDYQYDSLQSPNLIVENLGLLCSRAALDCNICNIGHTKPGLGWVTIDLNREGSFYLLRKPVALYKLYSGISMKPLRCVFLRGWLSQKGHVSQN